MNNNLIRLCLMLTTACYDKLRLNLIKSHEMEEGSATRHVVVFNLEHGNIETVGKFVFHITTLSFNLLRYDM